LVFILLSIIIHKCDQNPFHPDKESQLLSNKPPETFLFLFISPDSLSGNDSLQATEIDTTASKQLLHW